MKNKPIVKRCFQESPHRFCVCIINNPSLRANMAKFGNYVGSECLEDKNIDSLPT